MVKFIFLLNFNHDGIAPFSFDIAHILLRKLHHRESIISVSSIDCKMG